MIVGTPCWPCWPSLIAAPLGVGTAIYLTEYTRESRVTQVIRFGADCLAGIPSIIFGLFGFVFFVITLRVGLVAALRRPDAGASWCCRRSSAPARRPSGPCPPSYREVSYSLGGTRWQTVTRVVLPAALPGIVTGIMLSIGRSIGETAAVIFTAGCALHLPTSLF